MPHYYRNYNPAKKKKKSKLVLTDQGGTRVGEREN